jgi:peptidoglycan biosynthesis protein MviN/MurJ (putative lipid II flippase)
MLVNVGGCYLLAPSMGAPGIALANSISAVAQLVVLRLLLRKHLDVSTDRLTIKSALLSVGCGGLAGAGVWSLQNHFGTQSVTGFVELSLIYGVMLVVGGALYFGAALLCRHPELAQLREIIQRRRRR